MSPTTLLVARHGNTFEPGEVILRIGRRTDMPLSQAGMEQGRALGEHLKQNLMVPEIIFSSPMTRAMQMAQQVQKAIGHHIPVETMEEFIEIDYGQDENQPEEKVRERIGEESMKAWEEHSLPPIGWHVDTTSLRAAWVDFSDRILRDFEGKNVLLITHNGVARFASVLTGDTQGLHTVNARLSTGAYSHFVHNEGILWNCLDWNIKP